MNQSARAHPDAETLERFLRGELAREEAPAVVRHLLSGCRQCVAVTQKFWNLATWPRALQIPLQEGLASPAQAEAALRFRIRLGRKEEP